MISVEELRTILGGNGVGPAYDLDDSALVLYLWIRHQIGVTHRAKDDPEYVWERGQPVADGPPVVVSFLDGEPPVDAMDVDLVRGLYHTGWLYDYKVTEPDRSMTKFIVVPAQRLESGIVRWALQDRMAERAKERDVSNMMLEFMGRDGVGPIQPVDDEASHGRPKPDSLIAPETDDESGVEDRLSSAKDAMQQQKSETDEIVEERKERWRDRQDDVYGFTGTDPHEDELPRWIDPDGPFGYKANKEGLWHLYMDEYQDKFDVDPPNMYTANGKPSAKANVLANLADEFSVPKAMSAVVTLVSGWDEIRWNGPPVPKAVYRLGQSVCFSMQQDEPALSEVPTYDDESEDDPDEWSGQDDDELDGW